MSQHWVGYRNICAKFKYYILSLSKMINYYIIATFIYYIFIFISPFEFSRLK